MNHRGNHNIVIHRIPSSNPNHKFLFNKRISIGKTMKSARHFNRILGTPMSNLIPLNSIITGLSQTVNLKSQINGAEILHHTFPRLKCFHHKVKCTRRQTPSKNIQKKSQVITLIHSQISQKVGSRK